MDAARRYDGSIKGHWSALGNDNSQPDNAKTALRGECGVHLMAVGPAGLAVAWDAR